LVQAGRYVIGLVMQDVIVPSTLLSREYFGSVAMAMASNRTRRRCNIHLLHHGVSDWCLHINLLSEQSPLQKPLPLTTKPNCNRSNYSSLQQISGVNILFQHYGHEHSNRSEC